MAPTEAGPHSDKREPKCAVLHKADVEMPDLHETMQAERSTPRSAPPVRALLEY